MAKGSAKSINKPQSIENPVKAKSILFQPSGWDCNSPLDDLINSAGASVDTDDSLSDSGDEGVSKQFFLNSPATLMAEKIEALESASALAVAERRTSSAENDVNFSPNNRRAKQRRRCDKDRPSSTSASSHDEESRGIRCTSGSTSEEDRSSSRCSECDEEIMAAFWRSELQKNAKQAGLSRNRAYASAARSSAMSSSSSSTLDSFYTNSQRKISAARPCISVSHSSTQDDQSEQRNFSRLSNLSTGSSSRARFKDVEENGESSICISSPTPERWPQNRKVSSKDGERGLSFFRRVDPMTEQKTIPTSKRSISSSATKMMMSTSPSLPLDKDEDLQYSLISPALNSVESSGGNPSAISSFQPWKVGENP